MSVNEWQEKFGALRDKFIKRSHERLSSVLEMLAYLEQQNADEECVKEVRQIFHWYAGSGGVYGYERVSSLGLQAEALCDATLHAKESISPEKLSTLKMLAQDIQNIMENGEDQKAPERPQPATEKNDNKEYILLLTESPGNIEKIIDGLNKTGMRIELTADAEQATTFINRRLPEALLVTLPLANADPCALVRLIRDCPGGERPPVLFLSRQAGFLDKVEAIKAGIDSFFEQPLDEEQILDKLTHLLERDKPETYKILSVEDDPDQAEFIKLTLESAGYNVVSIQDPSKFEETLLQTDPDLVLLDVMLGSMTGFELAQYIRQQDRYAPLPVVFLTTENAIDMHVRSARIGGDDHLIKPIAPQLLAAAIGGRLEKARTLKRLIERDGLSGCLSFGAFMDKAIVFTQGKTAQDSLTLLLFDIDSMRIINDRFGYAVGDKVISSIGRKISKLLRNATLLGRVAGDRFAAIIEGLSVAASSKLCKEVIDELSKLQQFSANANFHCTTSASCVVIQANDEFRSRLKVAENQLREAKEQGGNQVSCEKVAH